MTTGTRPATVTAVFVLLVLIAVYQIVMSLLALVGATAMATVPMVAESAQVPAWAVLTGAAVGLVYGALSAVLAVMVNRNRGGVRTSVTAVNAVYAVVILALLLTPVSGVPEIVAALFAVTVAALANTATARAHFSGAAVPSGHAHPQVG
ncbi:hypothetical protein [Nocardiopsis sp. HUAS JQ3]|uniref:hypothetical protein n=1 Tax=Nocardiopsis sp. HUAS JQ3 TaxID=3061629 RepID=UPI0023AA174B|nr:hypothetical protein [Nocardiopsis sp. HUAS JQ3]WDZ92029.1 hypothetical protein PV789_05640 [Nocardiopsis sp. HUAS JQ3]